MGDECNAVIALRLMNVAADPMLPRNDGRPVLVGPLAAVTLTTGDLAACRRFYQGALGLSPEFHRLQGAGAQQLAAHWGLPTQDEYEYVRLYRPGLEGALQIRLIGVDAALPARRPNLDSRFDGPLGVGLPVRDLQTRNRVVEAMGFGSTAGLTSMAFPRADGSTYDIGEVHWIAPDEVMVLGVDRAHLQPVGPIDPAIDIGGPAYSSTLISDTAHFAAFFGEVLGLELRREFTFQSEGPSGGMRLPAGTQVHFQQWFAPGSRSGYLVVMQLLQNALRPPVSLAAPSRGIALWSFPTADLEATLHRARTHATPVLREIQTIELPGEAAVRSAVVATPDGFAVEIYQR
jgi:catechol 2,3-dioxygenase-like lactoylglutathione lyase family enzyme